MIKKFKGELISGLRTSEGKNGEYLWGKMSYSKIVKNKRKLSYLSIFFFSQKFEKTWTFLKRIDKGQRLIVQGRYNKEKNWLAVEKIENKLVNLSKEVFSILDKSNSFMILDIETSYHGEIIEIGYLVYDKEEEKILKSKNYLVRPKVITNNFFNNIKIEEIEKGLRIKEVIELISDDIKNNTLVGHNIKSFDYPKISKEWEKVFHSKFPHDNLIDTYLIYKEFFKKHICHDEATMGKSHKKCYSLENITRQIINNKNYKEKHRAFLDALDNLMVFKEILRRFDYKSQAN